MVVEGLRGFLCAHCAGVACADGSGFVGRSDLVVIAFSVATWQRVQQFCTFFFSSSSSSSSSFLFSFSFFFWLCWVLSSVLDSSFSRRYF